MLDDLVSGKEKSRFILLLDTVQYRGDCLLKHITQGLLKSCDAVIAFIFDENPKNFQAKFNDEPRLFCHDGFSDHLNWNKACLDENSIKSPFFLKRSLDEIFENDNGFKQILKSGQPTKIGVIINSLSSFIIHQDITTVCRDILEVMQWNTQVIDTQRTSEHACDIVQTVALVHCDLHEDNVLSSLNYMASTVIELQQKTENGKDNIDGCYNLVHCKRSGKIQREKEGYKIGPDFQLRIIPINENVQASLVESENPDVTSGLTFNLSLTDEQKEARSHLQLPYLLDDKIKRGQLDLGNKGQIFYQADEADDMDEEDPDDDLNI